MSEHDQPEAQHPRRSALLDLLRHSSMRAALDLKTPDLGLSEHLPYPFLAIVGQVEMRTALLLSVINPNIGGVLLIGPRGTGKTTAVRSLTSILPYVEVSDCEEGVLEEDLKTPDAELLYPDCYERHTRGESISHYEPVKMVELPLNARLEDVVGGINERIAVQRNMVRLERGILSRADNNILYVDEVNLLEDPIVDAILDASAQGHYTVRRGAVAGTYRSRFVLIGSMNPEEGRLRPQILDRFGLRVIVRGLTNTDERIEVYQRMHTYRRSPATFIQQWEHATAEALDEVIEARERLKETTLSASVMRAGFELINRLEIDSHRADYTMFEAARAHAATDGRTETTLDDLRLVAPLALRLRRSEFMLTYAEEQQNEDEHIRKTIDDIAS